MKVWLQFLMSEAGFKSDKELADFFKVTLRTVRNWRKNGPPYPVLVCLQLMAGQLDSLGKPWRGFRLTPEAIESPDGDFIYAYEVRAIRYVYQSAGLERARICTMLKHQTPIKRKKPQKLIKAPQISVVTDGFNGNTRQSSQT